MDRKNQWKYIRHKQIKLFSMKWYILYTEIILYEWDGPEKFPFFISKQTIIDFKTNLGGVNK